MRRTLCNCKPLIIAWFTGFYQSPGSAKVITAFHGDARLVFRSYFRRYKHRCKRRQCRGNVLKSLEASLQKMLPVVFQLVN